MASRNLQAIRQHGGASGDVVFIGHFGLRSRVASSRQTLPPCSCLVKSNIFDRGQEKAMCETAVSRSDNGNTTKHTALRTCSIYFQGRVRRQSKRSLARRGRNNEVAESISLRRSCQRRNSLEQRRKSAEINKSSDTLVLRNAKLVQIKESTTSLHPNRTSIAKYCTAYRRDTV